MLIGLLLSLGAALTTGIASVLQALAARRGDHADVGHLVLSPLYIAGNALDLLGFFCIVAALHWLPLFLVQCAAASSVGVTASVGRRVLRSQLPRRDLGALIGLGAGLVLLAAGAKAEAATAIGRSAQWWLVIAAAPVLVIGVVLLRLTRPRSGGALATVAGLAFAGTSVASRMLSDAHSTAQLLDSPAVYALAAFGIAGMTFFAASLQRSAATAATATLFGVETIAASAVGLLALGDSTRRGFEVLTAIGFAATLGCALVLASSDVASERPLLDANIAAGVDDVAR